MNEHIVTLSREGWILIPVAVRNELNLSPGEPLMLTVVDDELRITSRISAIRQMQQRLVPLRDPERPVVDELLQERRTESECKR